MDYVFYDQIVGTTLRNCLLTFIRLLHSSLSISLVECQTEQAVGTFDPQSRTYNGIIGTLERHVNVFSFNRSINYLSFYHIKRTPMSQFTRCRCWAWNPIRLFQWISVLLNSSSTRQSQLSRRRQPIRGCRTLSSSSATSDSTWLCFTASSFF